MTGLVRIFGETSDVEGQFAVPFDPEATGNELAQVYESWNSGLGVDLTDVALTCVDRLGLGGTPTGDLCAAAARAVTAWGGAQLSLRPAPCGSHCQRHADPILVGRCG